MKQSEKDLAAADKFRNSIMHKRDGFVNGAYPYFCGWVIVEAFLAGIKHERNKGKKDDSL